MRRVILFLLLPILTILALLAAGTVALERYSQTPEMRAQVESFSSSWLGRPLSYESLRLGLWPPRLVIESASLPGSDPSGPELFKVRRLDVQIAIGPLLRREVFFRSLEIEGLDLKVVRDRSGLDIPWADSASPSDSGAASSSAEQDETSPWRIGFRRIQMNDANIALIDRTRSSPETYGFESVSLTAKGNSDVSPLKVDFSAQSIGGGGIRATGTSSMSGNVALEFELSSLNLSALGPYLGEGFLTEVNVSGAVQVKGPVADPEDLNFDLQLAAERLQWESDSLQGQVSLKGQFKALRPAPQGEMSLDAKAATVRIGEVIAKPVGTPLYLVSNWGAAANSASTVSFETIEIATIKGSGRIGWAPSFSLQLDSESFPVTALALLVPELSDSGAHGQLEIKNLIYQAEPPSLQGTVSAEGLHVVFENGGSMSLSVDLTGEGDAVAIEKGDFSSGDQHFLVSGKVNALDENLPFDLKIETPKPIRADAFLTGLSPSLSDVLYGPVTLTANLSGSGSSLSVEEDFFHSLNGDFKLEMGEAIPGVEEGGRIVGFSLLSSLFDALGKYSQLTRVTHLLLGDKSPDLSGMSDDSFEKARVIAEVKGGVCVIERARIVESSYAANLVGDIELANLSLDLRGKIELGQAAAAALGAHAKDGEIVVPVAHIRGTLDDPEVNVSESAVLSLTSQMVSNNVAIKTVLGGTDKVLPGAGTLLGSGLNALLGGKKSDASDASDESDGKSVDQPALEDQGLEGKE